MDITRFVLEEDTMTSTVVRRCATAAGLAAAAAALTVGPAVAQTAPDPSSGEVRVVSFEHPTTVDGLRLDQVALGLVAGAALAGAGVLVVRSTRRPHARPA